MVSSRFDDCDTLKTAILPALILSNLSGQADWGTELVRIGKNGSWTKRSSKP